MDKEVLTQELHGHRARVMELIRKEKDNLTKIKTYTEEMQKMKLENDRINNQLEYERGIIETLTFIVEGGTSQPPPQSPPQVPQN